YLSQVGAEVRSPGARQGLSAEAALKHLLEGTGLHFQFLNARVVRILAVNESAHPAPSNEHLDEGIVSTTALRAGADDDPGSIVSWSAREMAFVGLKDIAGIANLTPGVEFDAYPDYGAGIETNISIRGINARDGSTVAIYLDDIPLPVDPLDVFGRPFPYT